MVLTTPKMRFSLRRRRITFLFSTVSRPVLGSKHPPIQWLPEFFRWGWNSRDTTPATHLSLAPKVSRAKARYGQNCQSITAYVWDKSWVKFAPCAVCMTAEIPLYITQSSAQPFIWMNISVPSQQGSLKAVTSHSYSIIQFCPLLQNSRDN